VLDPSAAGSGDTVQPRQTIEASDCKRFRRIESPLLDEECRIRQATSAASAAALGEWVAQTTPAQAVQDAPLQFSTSSSRGWALADAPSAVAQSSSESDSRSTRCNDGPVQLQTVNAFTLAMPSGDSHSDRRCRSGLAQLCQLYGDEGSSLDGEASSSEGEAET